MTPRTLCLKRRRESPRETAAWFMAGGDSAAWLEELCRWNAPQETLKLFVTPRAREDRAPGGLLVIPTAGSAMPRKARALALGVIEGKLFLPSDADLHPPVTAPEARAFCAADVSFFHPGIGLLEFRTEDALRVWDLLQAPEFATADWNGAQAGSGLDSRLAGVTLAALPGIDEVFGDAQKEIGSAPRSKLPARSGEPSAGAAGRIGRAVAGLAAAALSKAFSIIPGGGSRRTWIKRVLDWAAAKLVQISQEMEELRHQELHRLMSLLESDPERGLRHALPLAGAPGRGRATPGTHLGARDTSFNLGRLGGGQPADPWAVPADLRMKLTARYRELALREQHLGRFRRAAYIHAELLGDLSAAAAILTEGKLFAEAAVLYRDHLRQPRVAAECFVEGGLFFEAIAIYEKERAFLEVGDLLRKLGREEEASAAYRRVVEEKVAALDFIAAAGLLEGKLGVPEEALALLGKGWPHAPQAAKCLDAEFALLGKLGRHEAARRRLTTLRQEDTPTPQLIPLARILSGLAKTYPDHTIRPSAADLARVKISCHLTDGQSDETRAGIMILRDLVPEDRLLARDASRFLADRIAQRGPLAAPPSRPRKTGSGRVLPPQPVRKFRVPLAKTVLMVKRCGRDFVAVIQPMRVHVTLVIMRASWSGQSQIFGISYKAGRPKRISLILDELSGQPNCVVTLATPHFNRVRGVLEPTGSFRFPLRVTVPPWLPDGVAAMSISEGDWRLLRGLPTEIILETRSEDGRLIASLGLTHLLEEIAAPVEHVSMLALRSHVWVAFDRHLYLFDGGKKPRHWECESAVLGLEASAPFLPRAAVARCAHGATVFWSDDLDAEAEVLAPHFSEPHAAFLRNGVLVLLSSVAGPEGFPGQVIDLDRRGVQSAADFIWKGPAPVAVLGTDRPDEFAVFTEMGEVQVFGVPTARE